MDSLEEAAGALFELVHQLGGRIVRGDRIDDSDASVVRVDVSLGTLRDDVPRYAQAEPGSAAHWLLANYLGAAADDARTAISKSARQELLAEKAGLHPITLLPNRHGIARMLTRLDLGDGIVLISLGGISVEDPDRDEQACDVVATFANTLRRMTRATDHSGHYGGHLAVLLKAPGDVGTRKLVERLERHWLETRPQPVDFFSGAAIISDGGWRAGVAAASKSLQQAQRGTVSSADRSSAGFSSAPLHTRP